MTSVTSNPPPSVLPGPVPARTVTVLPGPVPGRTE